MTVEQDLDLLATTQSQLNEYKWTDNISSITKFIFLNKIFKKHKVDFQGGKNITVRVAVNPSTAARATGVIGPLTSIAIVDHLTSGTIPWRRGETSWGIDAAEMSMNMGKREIVDLQALRRAGGMISAAELLETQGWSQPTDSNDSLSPYGIPTYIVPRATASGSLGGFNGGNPYGFTTGVAIDSTVYTNYKNYTDSAKAPTKLDLVRKMRRAVKQTDFESPVEASVPSYASGDGKGIYTDEYIETRLEEIAEQQNDNLGNDVASKDGQSVFRRIAITRAPKLDVLGGTGAAGATGTFVNATYDSSGGMPVHPVYGIDWSVMGCCFLKGWYMRQDGPYIVPGQRTTYGNQVYWIWNPVCYDRRRQWVITF